VTAEFPGHTKWNTSVKWIQGRAGSRKVERTAQAALLALFTIKSTSIRWFGHVTHKQMDI